MPHRFPLLPCRHGLKRPFYALFTREKKPPKEKKRELNDHLPHGAHNWSALCLPSLNPHLSAHQPRLPNLALLSQLHSTACNPAPSSRAPSYLPRPPQAEHCLPLHREIKGPRTGPVMAKAPATERHRRSPRESPFSCFSELELGAW
jgi:hypothetical protein